MQEIIGTKYSAKLRSPTPEAEQRHNSRPMYDGSMSIATHPHFHSLHTTVEIGHPAPPLLAWLAEEARLPFKPNYR